MFEAINETWGLLKLWQSALTDTEWRKVFNLLVALRACGFSARESLLFVVEHYDKVKK